LSIVRDHHLELNPIHVSTAFNKLGKMAKSRKGAGHELAGGGEHIVESRDAGTKDETWAALETAAVRVARDMNS
jgi:hypothetical protein